MMYRRREAPHHSPRDSGAVSSAAGGIAHDEVVARDTRESAQPPKATCPRREDLEFGSLLGEGAFARVVHVRDTRNNQEYALKMLDKRLIQAKGRTSSVMAERTFLSSFDHPGIVSLRFTFQDDYCLYFVLELVAGGELATQIARMPGGVCPLEFAQFYTAEIVAVLTYLRAKQVAHRDLKPENMLLTLDGHLKLVDFDAAVVVPNEGAGEGDTAGGCYQGQPVVAGTSFYLPPEILLKRAQPRQAYALDLWALGCILYQMMVGRTPFHAATEYLLFQRVLAGQYAFPPSFAPSARALVDALLVAEPGDRLGGGREGLAALKCHAFFGGSLAAFERLRRRPPPRLQARRRQDRLDARASTEDSSRLSFDLASSAECTPEVGQSFMAKSSTTLTVTLSPESLACLTPSPVFVLENVADVQPPPEASPRGASPRGASPRGAGGTVAQGRRQSVVSGESPRVTTISSSKRNSESGEGVLPCSPSAKGQSFSPEATTLSMRPSSSWRPPSPRLQARDWRSVVDVPFASWQLWLDELVRRKTLHAGEEVAICGSVVQRRLPCLKPKVLVLTDLPRLLILDPRGLRVMKEVDLASLSCGHAAQEDGGLINVKSSVEFMLPLGKRTYRCCDLMLGAEEWAAQLTLALSGQQSASAAAASAATCRAHLGDSGH